MLDQRSPSDAGSTGSMDCGLIGTSPVVRRRRGKPRASLPPSRNVVPAVRGCGEKITALRALAEDTPVTGGVMAGLVIGISDAMTPAGLAYFTKPFSSSRFDYASGRRAQNVAQNHLDLKAFFRGGPARSPIALSSTPCSASRVNVFSLPAYHAIAWLMRFRFSL